MIKQFFKGLAEFIIAVVLGGIWSIVIMGGAILCWLLLYAIITGGIGWLGV